MAQWEAEFASTITHNPSINPRKLEELSENEEKLSQEYSY
jgi:hypothetical protein